MYHTHVRTYNMVRTHIRTYNMIRTHIRTHNMGQEGSMNWKAPPPNVACPGIALLWCCPSNPTCPEVVWCVRCPDSPDHVLVELELEARDKSDGNFLELSILMCSWSLLTHTEMTSSLVSSCITRNGCCYDNTT